MHDFIIVGAGSAGCVLANRLSADARNRVVLIEAGGRDWNPLIHMPAGVAELLKRGWIDWGYRTEPEAATGGRPIDWPRGKVLGGSSSLNAMLYVRGHPSDYDDWERQGATGWDWQSVLPYFRKAETRVAGGATDLRGGDGPLTVSPVDQDSPLARAFLAAAVATGLPRTDDFNGHEPEGVGFYETTTRNRRRCSAAAAYLDPVKTRQNLTIVTGCCVSRVRFQGRRAVGVEATKGGARIEFQAAREVILCGGAINSPQILMLSGIGAPDELQAHGLGVLVASPGVGANLQDHYDVTLNYRCPLPVTFKRELTLLGGAVVLARYLVTGRGAGARMPVEAGGFVASRPGLGRADLQFHLVPALVSDREHRLPHDYGFGLHVCQLRPESRGRIRLASADPRARVRIEPHYLATETDRRTIRDGVILARRILADAAMAPYRGEELTPGAAVTGDEAIDRFVAAAGKTIYHPIGTCRMGNDAQAVVDPALRVRGVEGLRVVDASVMPSLIGGNTNAPTIMIAERAADLILGGG